MFQQYYQVNNVKCNNFYSALLETKATGHFAEFVLPEDHLQALQNVDIEQLTQETTKSLMHKKLCYLKDNFGKLRLFYSGGTDSHTILNVASDAGIVWDSAFMWFTSVNKDFSVDYEYKSAFEYIKQNNHLYKDLEIYNYTIEDYEVWFDEKTPYKYKDFYHGFRPCFDKIHTKNIDTENILAVHGAEKPLIYVNKQKEYFWVITDAVDYNNSIWHTDFFQDGFLPELAVKQAYLAKEYFQKVLPERTGWLDYKSSPNLIQHLGLDIPVATNRKTAKAHADDAWLNHKHKRAIEEIQLLGRQDIINAWLETSDLFINEMKDIPYGIDIVPVQVDCLNTTVNIAQNTQRIGAIFKLNNNNIELLSHKDISQC